MFESELSDVTAEDVLAAFHGDRCVHMVDPEELSTVPVVKLAVKYGLASSNCKSCACLRPFVNAVLAQPQLASSCFRADSTTTTNPSPKSNLPFAKCTS